ncbi:MAG: DUF4125 family protein [Brotaphodocola sp.]
MKNRENLEQEILDREWNMFTNVQNEGERASCQDDRVTFEVMRRSQLTVWDEASMASWLNDLESAEAEGRNLMADKYGFMMQDTAPQQYEMVREFLPELSPEKRTLVDKLTDMQVRWMEQFHEQYPCFGAQGRPVHKEDACCGDTSLETYARGELSSYSENTLRLLMEDFQMLESQEQNPGMRIMEYIAHAYGFDSVDAAEEQLRKQRESRK